MALELKEDRYDIGDKFGYMKAITGLGLQRDEKSSGGEAAEASCVKE